MKALFERLADAKAENPDLSEEELILRMMQTFQDTPTPAEARAATPVDTALDWAAVIAGFDIEDLIARLPNFEGRSVVERVRSALVRNSSPQPGCAFRVLNTSERRSRIQALHQKELLAETLSASLWATDMLAEETSLLAVHYIFRRALQFLAKEGLRAAIVSLDDNTDYTDANLAQRSQVLGWIVPDTVEDPSLDAFLSERRLSFRQRLFTLESCKRLDEQAASFIGRRPLIAELSHNLMVPPASGAAPIVAIHGMGGIGKSAIISALTHHLMQSKPDLLVAKIDFDRPGFGVAGNDFLTTQIVEQLSAQAAVSQTGALQGSNFYKVGRDVGSQIENTDGSLDQLDVLLAQLDPDRPVLLIFDTLEERQRHGASQMSFFASWLDRVARGPWARNLAILVAGRAKPDVNDFHFPQYIDEPIDEMAPDERVALLSQLGHAEADAQILAPLSGNPLLLHLVSRLIQRDGGPTAQELMADDVDPQVQADVLHGMVYDRILLHVENPKARKLAYPGLVLREVTPDLIARVIAPVVLDGEITDPLEAETLFEALRREVWLVEDDGPQRVRHRADVRRLMMAYLTRDDSMTAKSRNIHERALAYFKATGNARESNYHSAMLADPNAFSFSDPITAQRILEDIGGDVDFVPDAFLALLKAKSGERLSDKELALLPTDLWAEQVDVLGKELLEEGDLRRAVALWSPDRDLPVPLWLIEARDGMGEHIPVELVDVEETKARMTGSQLWTLILMRQELWDEATLVAQDMIDVLQNTAAQKTMSGDDITRRLELLSYFVISSSNTGETSMSNDGVSAIEMQQRNSLEGILRQMNAELLKVPPPLARLAMDTLSQLEELHRVHRLFLSHHRVLHYGALKGRSRFQFVPSAPWINQAHAAARESHESLYPWGSLERNIHRALDAPGSLSVRDITQDMASDAVEALAKLPGPYQATPMFRGTGYKEHRLPLRFALADALMERPSVFHDVIVGLRVLCETHECIVPEELFGLAKDMPRSIDALDQLLVPIIHYADQCGLLPQYCAALRDYFPQAAKLNRVIDDLHRWSEIVLPPDLTPEANTPVILSS